MDLTIPNLLVISSTTGLGKYSIVRITNMDIASLYGTSAFPGNWTLWSVWSCHETRSLSQSNYSKSNGAIQTRKIKQEPQTTEDADVRIKALSIKKIKIKKLCFLWFTRAWFNWRTKTLHDLSMILRWAITGDPFSEQHPLKPKQQSESGLSSYNSHRR